MKEYVLYSTFFIECNYLGEEEYRPSKDYIEAESNEEALTIAKDIVENSTINDSHIIESSLTVEETNEEIASFDNNKWTVR